MKAILPFLVAAAASAGPAAAQPGRADVIQPGYWESTNRLLSPIRTSKVERRCITPADVEKFLAGPSNHHYDCTYPSKLIENGVIRMSGTCVKRKGGGKVKVEGEGVYTQTSFKITATIATEIAGIPLSGRASTEARRIGDSCPATPES
ncbi:MAG TPA: DUF3617 family protein [Phenylobacterium sp.]|uniref:DUF3617 domain-containing protein n=1 Tax=Phenylobacterium sp. TaxID=1871053 RepID=UPI002B49EB96|nr:DUF3617 family protein [Phenylobacterium sp.]HKR89275.1 DUF3617 family protein [Phenylobacterium sp.]